MKKIIGLIEGGGTGPELIGCVKRVINTLFKGYNIRLIDFDNKKYRKAFDIEEWNAELEKALSSFYEEIRKKDGIILRGSLPAPILYKIREDMKLIAKLVPLNPYPNISTRPDIDILLIRENSQGVYHCQNIKKNKNEACGTIKYSKENLKHLAKIAFKKAQKRRGKLALVLKTSVLGPIGEIWREVFDKESEKFPNVEYSIRPSGAGFSDMCLFPEWFDVIVTDDQGGDIVADLLPSLLYGSRDLVPAFTIGKNGLYIYQTDHGTAKYLAGQNKMNPIGMLTSLSLAMKHSLNMRDEAKRLQIAIKKTLEQGYRTNDIYLKGDNKENHKLVGTREMTDLIINNYSL